MRISRLASALLIFFALCTSASAQGTAQTDPVYEVPLKIAYRISGSYAELRGNHFHAGLDMGTAGVENVEVHSAEKGWVSRVKVGPYGYGRALYISHPDGHTTVYGHLNGYAPKIDSLVRAKQYAEKSFAVELFLPEGQVTVARDEVVAYSGNTGGSGGPHLHFEVRDTKSEEPLNPLRFLPKVADNMRPTLYGVKVYALSADAQVAGASADKYFSLSAIAGRTVDCYGRVGVGIHCTDYFAAGGRPCGVIEVCLYDNEKLVFKSRVDHFPFDLNRHVNSLIDFRESTLNRRFIQRSFVSPGNKLPIYETVSTPTVVADGETHAMKYVVRDFAGNESTVSFTLRGRRNAGASTKKNTGYLVERGRTWTKDTAGVDVLIPRESLYDDEWVEIKSAPSAKGHGTVYSVGDRCVPLQKAITLTMAVPEKWKSQGKKVFVGRVAGSGLAYCGGDVRPDFGSTSVYVISAGVLSFGDFTLDVDTIAPTVKMRNKSKTVRLTDNIAIGVSDDKSGIDTYSVTIDGKWEVFEFDYKNARLKATPQHLGLKRGNHKLKAEVSDACGNVRTLEWGFVVN